MELRMQSHHWEDRSPVWSAAVVAGFLAGAVLMVLDLLWSAFVSGGDPWHTSHQIAAMSMGQGALASAGFDITVVTVALITHYVLGIIFALLLAAIIAPFHFDSSPAMAMLIGAIFGVGLYVLNFYGMVYFFPWMIDMRSWQAFGAQVAFGVVAAFFYWQFGSRSAESRQADRS